MSSLRGPRKKAGFFLCWRQLPKEVQSEKDVGTGIQAVVWGAIEDRRAVSVVYRAEADAEEHMLLIYPRQMYKRSGHLYLEGHSYPSDKYRTLRVDRIVSGKLVGRSTPKAVWSRLPKILKIILALLIIGWLLHLMGR